MITNNIVEEINSLPIEAQQQAFDFIAFLKTRYHASKNIIKSSKKNRLRDTSFIGMWEDRKDIQDTTSWVRQLRSSEWERN
ncbi:MAG: DUF2281 domain-containing protein [Desulfamplus sp.]|nr:DUF2281 domain-containing protein [Desulfamplus sp.]